MLLYIVIACFIISLIIYGCGALTQSNSDFLYYVKMTGKACVAVTGVVLFCLLLIFGINRTSEGSDRSSHQEEYKTLCYRVKNLPNLHDEFAFNKIDILNDVKSWNTGYGRYQYYSHNYWVGNLFAKSIYDDTSYIDLDDINLD